MKNLILISSVSLLLSACNSGQVSESNHERDSLLSIVNERTSSLNEFISDFNEVERNLDSVAVRQHMITQSTDKTGELKPNQKARINDEIAAINSLMDQNRKKIAELNRKLKNSGNKSTRLNS